MNKFCLFSSVYFRVHRVTTAILNYISARCSIVRAVSANLALCVYRRETRRKVTAAVGVAWPSTKSIMHAFAWQSEVIIPIKAKYLRYCFISFTLINSFIQNVYKSEFCQYNNTKGYGSCIYYFPIDVLHTKGKIFKYCKWVTLILSSLI